ncbi:MAG: outer membrane beta-barrel protein [Fermentimonas sp.]|nr:outer membrane beta-barrel protein [Fermentimonas sp.]
MTLKILSSLILCGILFPLNAQIKGVVSDLDSNPIEFANVAVYSLPDSTIIAGTTTDKTGSFFLNADNIDNKLLRVSFIGYETQTLPAKSEQDIVLNYDSTMLGEVVVNGDIPRIRLRNDAVVATVENTVLSKAGTANDVLKRLPAITGDDGDFSIFGKGKAKIYINNRELRDPSELDMIASSDISEVEIVHNPGAGYDASVKAIIRIHTVRKVGDGFSFDVRSTSLINKHTDLRKQLNLNYRYKGWDLFATVKYEKYDYIQNSTLTQTAYVDTLWIQANKLDVEGVENPLTTIAGINYEINPNHYVGLKHTMSLSPGKDEQSVITASDVFANNVFYDKWVSNSNQNSNNKPQNRLNVYYNGTFGKLKVDFNSDFYGGKFLSETNINESSEEFDDRVINSSNEIENKLFATRLILSYPFLGGQLSAGNEYTNTKRIDIYSTDMVSIPSTNTSFKDENKSFFAEFSRSTSIGKIGAGLRYEDVTSDYYNDDELNEEQSRKYARWFPNFSYSNSVGNVQLQISYNVKTVRPSYWQLGSNMLYGNRFTLQTGNPFLKPTIINDASFMSSWKFLQLMISYKIEKDAIIQWADQHPENPAIAILSTKNIDKIPNLSAFLTASPKLGIWSPMASVGFIKQWLTITSNSQDIKLNEPMIIASLNNSFSLPKGFLVTLDANYRGKGSTQNVDLKDNQFVLNVGVTKSFLNDKLTVIIKGQDIFQGNRNDVTVYNNKLHLSQTAKWDTRELEFTVRYKFNTNGSRYKGTGAGESEFNRL